MDILDLPDEILEPIFNIRCHDIEDEILKIEKFINDIYIIRNMSIVEKQEYFINLVFTNMNLNSYTINHIVIIAYKCYNKYKFLLPKNSVKYFNNKCLIDCNDYSYNFFFDFNKSFYKIFIDINNKEYFIECNQNIYFESKIDNNYDYIFYYYNKYNNKIIITGLYDLINNMTSSNNIINNLTKPIKYYWSSDSDSDN